MLEANFWQDKTNSQKVVKEKKFYEDLINSLNSSVEKFEVPKFLNHITFPVLVSGALCGIPMHAAATSNNPSLLKSSK